MSLVLLGSRKRIESYEGLAKRWFENITFLKFIFSAQRVKILNYVIITLHKKLSFPLRISSANVTFGHIYWINP